MVSVRHLPGSNNTVTGNTINEACAGILLGTGCTQYDCSEFLFERDEHDAGG